MNIINFIWFYYSGISDLLPPALWLFLVLCASIVVPFVFLIWLDDKLRIWEYNRGVRKEIKKIKRRKKFEMKSGVVHLKKCDIICNVGGCGDTYAFGDDYPRECSCGGLVHAEYGNEKINNWWSYEQCDTCDYIKSLIEDMKNIDLTKYIKKI